jgi:hypothetical protein
VAVALVVLLGQAAAFVHGAATPHVTCLEHGESVHIPVGHPGAHTPATAGISVAAAADEAELHGHEHCGVQAQRSATAADAARDASAAIFAPAPHVALAALPPPRHLLRLAPKTSPPCAPVA